ncbi:hypothetical protein [Flavobacterium agrisoli]|uniref:Parallel beta helix pectate lyase-like protein n=1 Tax=Flavobacterium agrisoli TaxID=2793066 RepID=A0A934PKX7_9FLAO|nr:hypothetical protein [Flavobacterium agrisoli]MBK0368813.1 hypothetical protein [Flavobacterium agrisoli]
MKKLLFLMLFSAIGFSQNYQYAVNQAPKPTEAQKGVDNQQEEIDYFNAYLLPITKKATLQQALDTYGSVRLEKGDYSGVDIVMKSNQKLYGHPSLTKVSNITIAAGSQNVHLEDLLPQSKIIKFESGNVISNCTFKTIKWAILQGTNFMLENSTIVNFMGRINFDCSQSGFFRNNKIIRHQIQAHSNQLIMKGNSVTPSYGNVHLQTNFLQPHGDATELDNLKSVNFVGIDAEAWNLEGEGTKSMFFARNMGSIKISDFGGGNSYSAVRTPSFDIETDEMYFVNKFLSFPTDVFSSKTNVLMINGNGSYIRKEGNVLGYDFLANIDKDHEIQYKFNGKNDILNNNAKNIISKKIVGTQYNPWSRPNWELIPDPLGLNWRTDSKDKPDSTAYIQNLIDKKGIAELPEGVFYIKSTLNLTVDGTKGIIGKGTGKTVIVGIDDTFPLITLVDSDNGSHDFLLSHITLQGGSIGVYSPDEIKLIAFTNLKYVSFRDQKYGIHLYRNTGFDNCFFDHLSFINCKIGFFQDPNPNMAGEEYGYVDKTVFYGGQFINCETAVSMRATRGDYLCAWINCKFDGNDLAFNTINLVTPIIANCDFTNHKGLNILSGSALSLYNCNFYNNKTTDAIVSAQGSFFEGCNLMDDIPVYSSTGQRNMVNSILNSTVKGNVLRNFGQNQSIFVNSSLLANPSLSKMLVNVKDNVPTVLINESPAPYPQFLVTQ